MQSFVGEPIPYNPANRILTAQDVENILGKYGLNIAGVNTGVHVQTSTSEERLHELRKAMVHRSYCIRKTDSQLRQPCPAGCVPLQDESNERLELLGDAVLNLMVAEYLYERFPTENEGFLTRLRSKLVNGQMLSELSLVLGLDKFVLLSKQVDENAGRGNKKILEDTFEAFVGALFLTIGNYERVRQWFITFLESSVDVANLVLTQNTNKDLLLKYFNFKHGRVPTFVEDTTKDTKGQRFSVMVKNPAGAIVGTGTGSSRKQAEDDAARAALEYYGVSAFEVSSL